MSGYDKFKRSFENQKLYYDRHCIGLPRKNSVSIGRVSFPSFHDESSLIVKKLHDSVVSIERTEHSEKPEYFRQIIDELYIEGKRIELFARTQTDTWDVWGDEVITKEMVRKGNNNDG